ELFGREQREFQFAPRWSAAELQVLFKDNGAASRMLFHENRLVGCAALWDQCSFKQAVVARYARRLSLARPVLNWAAAATGRSVMLPQAGDVIPQAFVSHLLTPGDAPGATAQLVS